MTEQMAQRWLEQFEFPTDENSDDALATICEALQEYPKFRAIGTVEELQALKEKSAAKKPIEKEFAHNWHGDKLYITNFFCPNCNNRVERSYCPTCGQPIDWE